nr:hypothetical protein [Tanacetum cinerariifolium]
QEIKDKAMKKGEKGNESYELLSSLQSYSLVVTELQPSLFSTRGRIGMPLLFDEVHA